MKRYGNKGEEWGEFSGHLLKLYDTVGQTTLVVWRSGEEKGMVSFPPSI